MKKQSAVFEFLHKKGCAMRQPYSSILLFHHPIPPSTAPAISATSASGTRTYFPSGKNQVPIFFSRPVFTAFSANSLSAIQKNMIAASIAPSGQI